MPYKKDTHHNGKAKKIVMIAAIIITALALACAGLYIYFSYQAQQEAKAAAAIEALPRIVVPQGHFATTSYEKATVDKSIKSLTIRPGIDIYTKPESTQETLEKETDALLNDLKTLEFNHIILDTTLDGNVIFTSEKLKNAPVDLVKIFLDKAKTAGINVSLKLDLTGTKKADDTVVDNLLDYQNKRLMSQTAAMLAKQYEFYGLQLDSYYAPKNGTSYKAFIESGMRENYEDWMLKSANVAFDEIIDAVKTIKPTLPVGLCIDNVWANINEKDEKTAKGSKTQSEFEALLDGHVDTKGLLESGKIDFINAVIPTSIPNNKESFQTIVNYWGALCKTSAVPMYVTHSGESASSKELIGWNGTDELSRQVALAVKSGNYYGSSFTGADHLVTDLKKNPDNGSTNYLLSYFRDEIKEAEMFSNLDIISPQKSSTVVYEDTIQFKMKFDPNAEVLLNGEKLTPSSRGGASVYVPLNVGKNTIKLEHKGITKIYNVERKVIIFKEVSPTGNLKMAGSSTIELTALAYTGSKVSATINGQTVALTEGGGGDDNNAESAYRIFTGSYTLPKATAKDQNIGSITFNGNYQGIYSASAKGASSIIIEKLADAVDPDSATGQPFPHATVTNMYAATFPYNTTGFPQAIPYQLPYGTQDIVVSENGDYYNLRSGITVLKNDVSLETKNFEGNNQVSQMTVGVEGNDTVIRLAMSWKSPFTLTPSPYPSYGLGKQDYEFAANKVTILLNYNTVLNPENVSGDMSASPIFSDISYKRIKNEGLGIWQYELTLPLRQAGRYYGCHAQWEDNTLVFKFNHPASGGSLNGIKVAVDPGHGGSDTGNTAGRDSIEKDTNLAVAFMLKSSLEAQGATVIMTRENDIYVGVESRVRFAEQNGCDLFISVHQNSSGGNSVPNGVQTYYNAPFSQPLAGYVEESLKTVVPQSKWNYWNGSRDSFNFVVTRERQFPSILVECAFSSNPADEARMLDPAHQQQFTDALARGVVNYYAAYN